MISRRSFVMGGPCAAALSAAPISAASSSSTDVGTTWQVRRRDPSGDPGDLARDKPMNAVAQAVETLLLLGDISAEEMLIYLTSLFGSAELIDADPDYLYVWDPVTEEWKVVCVLEQVIELDPQHDSNPVQVRRREEVVLP